MTGASVALQPTDEKSQGHVKPRTIETEMDMSPSASPRRASIAGIGGSPKRHRQGSFRVPSSPVKAAHTWAVVAQDEIADDWAGRFLTAAVAAAAYSEWRHFKKIGLDFRLSRTVGFLVENTGVLTLASLRSMLPLQERVNYKEDDWKATLRKLVRNSMITVMGGLMVEYGTVVLQHGALKFLWSKVPYFRKLVRNPSPLTLRSLKEWCKGNMVAQVGGNTFQVLVEAALSDEDVNTLETSPNSTLFGFLRNFFILRIVNDLFFYLGHRWMHVYPSVYKYIHKRHHTHMTTNLPTNFMFTPLDVLVEAAIPIGMGITVISKVFGINMGRFENNIMTTYMSWYDAGTHAGKNVPLISFFPPLSILYNRFVDVDSRAIWFHELHHNKIRCNYGITSWIDTLGGTTVWERQTAV